MKKTPEKQLAFSQAMVKKYSAAIKRATTCLKRWERREKYYQKRVDEQVRYRTYSKPVPGSTRMITLE